MNSKQRKLKYIRQKNSLRNGGVLTYYYKTMFSETSEDEQTEDLYRIIKNQQKRFKIKLKVKDLIFNYQNDDFTTDIVTTKVFLTRK